MRCQTYSRRPVRYGLRIAATAVLKRNPEIAFRSQSAPPSPLPKLVAGLGAGKTVFAPQCRLNAARRQRAPGNFVAFDESPRQIIANGVAFDSRRPREPGARGAAATTVVVLRLYIVGGAPNSVQAIANLQAICREHLKDGHRLEVIDVLEHPARAMADGVLVTPSLAKLFPLPSANVVGNLSDRSKVLLALGLGRKT